MEKRIGRYSRHKEELVQRPRGGRQWPILAIVSHFILYLAKVWVMAGGQGERKGWRGGQGSDRDLQFILS